jgi:hypothetical protein
VRFAYFPRCKFLFFRDFSAQAERIEKGLRAYDYAAQVGWSHVTDTLRTYGLLSRQFLAAPATYFSEMLAAARTQRPAAAALVSSNM